MTARALFAFVFEATRPPTQDETKGKTKRLPSEDALLGGMVLADAIDDIRLIALIVRKWAEAQAKAGRQAMARRSGRPRRR